MPCKTQLPSIVAAVLIASACDSYDHCDPQPAGALAQLPEKLHVNCGVSCHNSHKTSDANDVGFQLRLDYGQLANVQATPAVRTGINQTPSPAALSFVTGSPFGLDAYYDLRPLDPARSLVTVRMGLRELLRQMPPIATNRVDMLGLQTVTAWVEHMTTARGYPAAAR